MSLAREYFAALRRTLPQQSPNFWCSEEYFEKAGWGVVEHGPWKGGSDAAWYSVMDDTGKNMLPAVEKTGMGLWYRNCWAGFSTMDPARAKTGVDFLDYEFIYRPSDFMDLSGGAWHTTRKNMRWAEKDAGEGFQLWPAVSEAAIEELVTAWSEDSGEVEYYDPEIMLKYLFHGQNRLFVVGRSGRLYGILAWDSNWRYINFRYCVVRPGIRGLSDTARVMFYRFSYARCFPGLLVNDGGSLDRPGLHRYKTRLNPFQVNQIFTFK